MLSKFQAWSLLFRVLAYHGDEPTDNELRADEWFEDLNREDLHGLRGLGYAECVEAVVRFAVSNSSGRWMTPGDVLDGVRAIRAEQLGAQWDADHGTSLARVRERLVERLQETAMRLEEQDDYAHAIAAKWEGRTRRLHVVDVDWPLPSGWRATAERWCRMGVPVGVAKYAIDVAFDRWASGRFGMDAVWPYVCGIVRNKVDEELGGALWDLLAAHGDGPHGPSRDADAGRGDA